MPLSPPPNRRGRVCNNTGTSTRAEALETPFAALRNGALCRRRSGEKPQRAPGTSTPARKSKSISLLGNAFAANKLAPCPLLGRGVPSFSLLLSALLAHLFCEFMSVLSVARIQTFCYVCRNSTRFWAAIVFTSYIKDVQTRSLQIHCPYRCGFPSAGGTSEEPHPQHLCDSQTFALRHEQTYNYFAYV